MINLEEKFLEIKGYLSEEIQGQVFYGYYMQGKKKNLSLVYNISFSKSIKLFPAACFHYLKFYFILQNQPLFPLFSQFRVSLTSSC